MCLCIRVSNAIGQIFWLLYILGFDVYFWDPDVRIGYLMYFETRGVSLNVNCGSDFSFLLYLVVMASIVLSLNGNCTESWREAGRRFADIF